MDSETDDRFDPRQLLLQHAGHLNSIRRPRWFAVPYYELMSGAIIWPDETNRRTPTEVIWSLRMLWAYRTSLMLKEPRAELAQFWDLGLSAFPQWVGFRPERRAPNPKLLRIYRKGDVGLRKCLRDMEREAEGG
jgi:hypothetical protein